MGGWRSPTLQPGEDTALACNDQASATLQVVAYH